MLRLACITFTELTFMHVNILAWECYMNIKCGGELFVSSTAKLEVIFHLCKSHAPNITKVCGWGLTWGWIDKLFVMNSIETCMSSWHCVCCRFNFIYFLVNTHAGAVLCEMGSQITLSRVFSRLKMYRYTTFYFSPQSNLYGQNIWMPALMLLQCCM